VWLEKDNRFRGFRATLAGLEVQEVFGVVVATSRYLHQGHTWAAPEHNGRVRIGLDDFSQKVLGPADYLELPKPGQKIHHDRVGLALGRRGKKAAVLAPLDGIIETVNPRVRQSPALAHDDPYGEGWLWSHSTNLQPDLENLLWGQGNVAWIENEATGCWGCWHPQQGSRHPGTIS
jgi:glycine cleavage system H lipoate-binding protein